MLRPTVASGWFDDVAAAAVKSPCGLVIAICRDLNVLDELADWLDSAIPAHTETPLAVCRVEADELEGRSADSTAKGATVVVVADATKGADGEVSARWARWNVLREVLLGASSEPAQRRIVLLTTQVGMAAAAASAPDLLSVAEVLTITEDPYQVDPAEPDVLNSFRAAAAELEKRYAMTTEEFVSRLLERDLFGVTAEDQARWEAIAGALRGVDG